MIRAGASLVALATLAWLVGCAESGAPAAHREHAADSHAEHAAALADGSTAMPPSGYAPVPLDSAAAQRLGVTTAKVELRRFEKTVRTVGVVTADETRSSHVHPKVRGFIESVLVDFTGKEVKAGAPLCTIYSPDVVAAELELLTILERTPGASSGSGDFAQVERAAREQVLAAARRRLSLWDVPPAEIARLERTREPRRTFPLLAPRSGTVVEKTALAGMYVDAASELYLVSDLNRVWILIDLYQDDAPYAAVGTPARLTVEGLAQPLESPITFLAPTIDEATRTLKARFELDNRARKLRPGAFVRAELELPIGDGLAVPESAVIRTGERNIVFVVTEGRANPREVGLGPSVGGYVHVRAGLAAGEVVATGAQFLLDSESRIRATSAPMGGHVH